MRHQGAGSSHDHIIGKSGRQNLFIKCLAGQGMWQFCSPMRLIVYKLMENADHVGPKLFEPGPELMQSKQVPLKGLMRRKTMERVGDERFDEQPKIHFMPKPS